MERLLAGGLFGLGVFLSYAEENLSELLSSVVSIQRRAMVSGESDEAIREALRLLLISSGCESALLLKHESGEGARQWTTVASVKAPASFSGDPDIAALNGVSNQVDPVEARLLEYCSQVASSAAESHEDEPSVLDDDDIRLLAIPLRNPNSHLVGVLGLVGDTQATLEVGFPNHHMPLIELCTVLLESQSASPSDGNTSYASSGGEPDNRLVQFEFALNATGTGLWEWDRATGQVAWSEQCLHVLEANSLGDTIDGFVSLLHAEDAGTFVSDIEEATARDSSGTHEYRLLTERGSLKWIECSFLARQDAQKTLPTIVGTLRDVTESRSNAEQLREVREEFNAIIDRSPVAIFVKDLDGRYTVANEHARMALAEGRDVLGHFDMELLDPESAKAFREHDLEVLASNRVQEFEDTVIRDGYTRTFLAVKFPLHGLQGEPRALCGIATDITERKQAERELRLNQKSVDHAAFGVFWIRRDGSLHYVNDWVCRSLGYTRDELMQMSMFDFAEHDPESWADRFEQVKKLGSFHLESTHRRRDGSIYPVQVTAHYDENEGEEYLFAFVQDISERKESERLFEEQSAELLHASRLSVVGQMVAGLSHEVAQPLSAVGNYAAACLGILKKEALEDSQLAEYIDAILKQNHRCGEILKRLRDFSRTAVFRRSDCRLADILEESVKLVTNELTRHEVTVNIHIPDNLPDVHVDRVQIQQVVVNLLTNARDAMQQVPASRREIDLQAFADERFVGFRVSDRGNGIEEEQADKLFDAFYTTKEAGMGLGLSICQTIVSKHGGRIEAGNNREGGASFTVSLPRTQAGQA